MPGFFGMHEKKACADVKNNNLPLMAKITGHPLSFNFILLTSISTALQKKPNPGPHEKMNLNLQKAST